jgi:hypothetical protein
MSDLGVGLSGCNAVVTVRKPNIGILNALRTSELV